MRSAMSGACFANVSDFSYWRDLAAFNPAMSGACFANVSDFSY